MADPKLGIGLWKSDAYNQSLSLYNVDSGWQSGISALTTPGCTTSFIGNSGLSSISLCDSILNYGYGSGLCGYYTGYVKDIFDNMQNNGVKYPALTGQRTKLAGDMINETSMWKSMSLKDIISGVCNKYTALNIENIFNKLMSR